MKLLHNVFLFKILDPKFLSIQIVRRSSFLNPSLSPVNRNILIRFKQFYLVQCVYKFVSDHLNLVRVGMDCYVCVRFSRRSRRRNLLYFKNGVFCPFFLIRPNHFSKKGALLGIFCEIVRKKERKGMKTYT